MILDHFSGGDFFMRTPIIAGNWKMYKTPQEAVDFVNAIKDELTKLKAVQRVVCPPYVALPGVKATLEGTDIDVGAQDVHWEEEGAFTSQIAPGMLEGLVKYVIIGHSETREYLGVTDEMVNKKAKAALAHGLHPIIAVGESLAINEAGQTKEFVSRQIRAAFDGIPASALVNIVVAYEPIWAIGTGKSASGEQANTIIGSIRGILAELYGDQHAEAMRIQYGGSVKPDNMAEFMSQPHIDGALVGGASLKADSFIKLVQIAIEAKGLG
jgi:triosephosphate isomerase